MTYKRPEGRLRADTVAKSSERKSFLE